MLQQWRQRHIGGHPRVVLGRAPHQAAAAGLQEGSQALLSTCLAALGRPLGAGGRLGDEAGVDCFARVSTLIRPNIKRQMPAGEWKGCMHSLDPDNHPTCSTALHQRRSSQGVAPRKYSRPYMSSKPREMGVPGWQGEGEAGRLDHARTIA